ncbi:hypothetical protein D3C71_1505880 [compost metagenome]
MNFETITRLIQVQLRGECVNDAGNGGCAIRPFTPLPMQGHDIVLIECRITFHFHPNPLPEPRACTAIENTVFTRMRERRLFQALDDHNQDTDRGDTRLLQIDTVAGGVVDRQRRVVPVLVNRRPGDCDRHPFSRHVTGLDDVLRNRCADRPPVQLDRLPGLWIVKQGQKCLGIFTKILGEQGVQGLGFGAIHLKQGQRGVQQRWRIGMVLPGHGQIHRHPRFKR